MDVSDMRFRNTCSCKSHTHFCKNECKRCDSCICDQFSHLAPGAKLNPGFGGNIFNNDIRFACFNPKNCCTTFIVDGFPVNANCCKIHSIHFVSKKRNQESKPDFFFIQILL
jgi:hypothetical protein